MDPIKIHDDDEIVVASENRERLPYRKPDFVRQALENLVLGTGSKAPDSFGGGFRTA